jgi:hypothetical protein
VRHGFYWGRNPLERRYKVRQGFVEKRRSGKTSLKEFVDLGERGKL